MRFFQIAGLACVFACALPAVSAQQVPAPARGTRVQLRPKLAPGQVIRYQIEVQSSSNTSHRGAVKDPQGPANLIVTWDATVRLEVLPAPNSPSAAPGAAAPIRLRTTYEKSVATVKSDTPDPSAEQIEQEYARLQGRSMEFTILPGGKVSDVRGLDEVLTDEKAREAAQEWIRQVSGGSGTPAQGIVPGQTWASDRPADNLPLAGLRWRTDSTYLRNEPCHPADPARASAAPPPDSEMCAVILSRLSLVTARKLRDPTPDSYRKNGVRTAGHWDSSGQSLAYVSLRNGWVVSVTQNGSERMDVAFTNASGAMVRYQGTVGTYSEVMLLPPDSSVSR